MTDLSSFQIILFPKEIEKSKSSFEEINEVESKTLNFKEIDQIKKQYEEELVNRENKLKEKDNEISAAL